MKLAVIIPTHNDSAVIGITLKTLVDHKQAYNIVKVLLAENGSTDSTNEVCQKLAADYSGDFAIPLHEPKGGVGYGIHSGIQCLLDNPQFDFDFVLITGSDLPFGFSDLVEFYKQSALSPNPFTFYIGSKGHPQSQLSNSLGRRVISAVFRFLRFITLGLQIRDTQGTFILPRKALPIASLVKSRDFFYTTELCFHLRKAKYECVELPVKMEPAMRASTVRPFRHGMALLKQLFKLRLKSCSAILRLF